MNISDETPADTKRPYLSEEKLNFIDKWLDNVEQCTKQLTLDELEQVVFHMENVSLGDPPTTDGYCIDKENTVHRFLEKQFKQARIEHRDNGATSTNKAVNSNCLNQDSKAECPSIKRMGGPKYWVFNDKHANIEKRLEPQRFHHHQLKPSYMKANSSTYRFEMDFKCPNSGTDGDLENYRLLTNDRLKQNAVSCRYKRIQVSDPTKMDYLCRLCPFQRWIPVDNFRDHMGMAHGIVDVKGFKLIVLPPPRALYRQTLGKLKFYYCQCSKCFRWIRLGKMAGVRRISDGVIEADSINDNKTIVGLYTNYFYHFMTCSLDCVT